MVIFLWGGGREREVQFRYVGPLGVFSARGKMEYGGKTQSVPRIALVEVYH